MIISQDNEKKLSQLAEDLKENVTIKDRKHHFRNYPSTEFTYRTEQLNIGKERVGFRVVALGVVPEVSAMPEVESSGRARFPSQSTPLTRALQVRAVFV